MKVLILGAAGMIGRKLANAIASDEAVSEIFLHDVIKPEKPNTKTDVSVLTGNAADMGEAEKLAALEADVIFNLAAIVSGDAEANFEKGWDVSARGGWNLLEALRKPHLASSTKYVPRFIFTSSIAVFGPPYPEKIPDEFPLMPRTSYGSQKAVMELLVSDYSRKGYIDGCSLRLPTICVRPGKPNLAASSFFSGIIREPLNGQEAVLPVPDTVRHWHASPRSAVRFLTHASKLDLSKLGDFRSINLPGVSCTVAEQIEALRKVAGEEVARLIKPERDETVAKIVAGWPRDFAADRARSLGFSAEKDFEEIIRVYLEDDFQK